MYFMIQNFSKNLRKTLIAKLFNTEKSAIYIQIIFKKHKMIKTYLATNFA